MICIGTNDIKMLAHWYITTRCNSRCQTCSIWADDRISCEESSIKSKLVLLRQLKVMRYLPIDFTGGEPLLYPGLPALIKAARKLGFLTWLTTNSLLYPKYAEDFRATGSKLSFNLDSPFERVNAEIRGVPHIKKAIKAMNLAISLGSPDDKGDGLQAKHRSFARSGRVGEMTRGGRVGSDGSLMQHSQNL